MSVSVSTREFAPFGTCVVISNGDAEALVTVDVGPRIISYKAFGKESFLFADTERAASVCPPCIKEAFGKEYYHIYGGHRLWWTPERMPETYYPDDEPVKWEQIENGASFTPNEQPTGVQLSFDVIMDESGAGLTIVQRVKNTSDEVRRHAAWGITQCRGGGVAIVPQNDRDCAPLPNRAIVHWPYNDMLDARFLPAARYITLSQSSVVPGPFKFGFNNEAGWCGYIIDGQMLYKNFGFDAQAVYPDYGCNFESYTDVRALEVESLSGELSLAPGETVGLTERWNVLSVPDVSKLDDLSSDEFADMIDAMVADA